MATNQTLKKSILDLKKKILDLEEDSGGRLVHLRRLYNRMLQGGVGFIPEMFRKYFKKFDELIDFLKNKQKMHEQADTLVKCIDKMNTVIGSIGKVTVQYSGPSIPKNVKTELEQNKETCHNEIKAALEKCFYGTKDGTAGYFYAKLMKESTEIDIQSQRETWINSYAAILHPKVKDMEKSMHRYRNTVGEKIQEYSSSESDISDAELDPENFAKTFEEHTNKTKNEN